MTANTENFITCRSCYTINEKLDALCQQCGLPLAPAAATLGPLSVGETRDGVLKARERRPRLVVVLGLWLIFFPFLVHAAMVAFDILLYYRTRSNFMIFWLAIGSLSLSVLVLYRITRNYLTLPPRRKDMQDEVKGDG
jgi:hypothetical protein